MGRRRSSIFTESLKNANELSLYSDEVLESFARCLKFSRTRCNSTFTVGKFVEWMKYDKIFPNLYRDVTLFVNAVDQIDPSNETVGFYKFKVRVSEAHWFERLLFDIDRVIPLHANFSLQYHNGQRLQEVGQHGILFDTHRVATLRVGTPDAPLVGNDIRNTAVRYGWVKPAAKLPAGTSGVVASSSTPVSASSKNGIVELTNAVLQAACTNIVDEAVHKFEQFAAKEFSNKSALSDDEGSAGSGKEEMEDFQSKVSAAAKWSLLFKDGNGSTVRKLFENSFLEAEPYVRAAGRDVCKNEEIPFVHFTAGSAASSGQNTKNSQSTSLSDEKLATLTSGTTLESSAPKQVFSFWNVAGMPKFSSLIFDFSDKITKSMRQIVRSVYTKHPSVSLETMKETLLKNLDISNYDSEGFRVYQQVVAEKHGLCPVLQLPLSSIGAVVPSLNNGATSQTLATSKGSAKKNQSSPTSKVDQRAVPKNAQFSTPIIPPANMKSLLAPNEGSMADNFLRSQSEEEGEEEEYMPLQHAGATTGTKATHSDHLIMPRGMSSLIGDGGLGESAENIHPEGDASMFAVDETPGLFSSSSSEAEEEEEEQQQQQENQEQQLYGKRNGGGRSGGGGGGGRDRISRRKDAYPAIRTGRVPRQTQVTRDPKPGVSLRMTTTGDYPAVVTTPTASNMSRVDSGSASADLGIGLYGRKQPPALIPMEDVFSEHGSRAKIGSGIVPEDYISDADDQNTLCNIGESLASSDEENEEKEEIGMKMPALRRIGEFMSREPPQLVRIDGLDDYSSSDSNVSHSDSESTSSDGESAENIVAHSAPQTKLSDYFSHHKNSDGVGSMPALRPIGKELPPMPSLQPIGKELPPMPALQPIGKELSPMPALHPIGKELPPMPALRPIGKELPPMPALQPIGKELPPMPALQPIGKELPPMPALQPIGKELPPMPALKKIETQIKLSATEEEDREAPALVQGQTRSVVRVQAKIRDSPTSKMTFVSNSYESEDSASAAPTTAVVAVEKKDNFTTSSASNVAAAPKTYAAGDISNFMKTLELYISKFGNSLFRNGAIVLAPTSSVYTDAFASAAPSLNDSALKQFVETHVIVTNSGGRPKLRRDGEGKCRIRTVVGREIVLVVDSATKQINVEGLARPTLFPQQKISQFENVMILPHDNLLLPL